MKKIILTEKQFAKNILLNEYKGEQLVLPFDGNSHAYHDMQFMDYLQHNSVGKTLSTKYKTPQDYFNTLPDDELIEIFSADLLDLSIWEDMQDLFDKEMDYDDFNNLFDLINLSNNPNAAKDFIMNIIKERYLNFISELTVREDGLIYIEREVGIPNIKADRMFFKLQKYFRNQEDTQYYDFLNQMFKGNVGVCWAYMKGSGQAYDNMFGNKTLLTLQGYTRCEDVNWATTFEFQQYNEYELRLKDNGLVEITNISVKMPKGLDIQIKNIKADYPFVVRA